MAVEQWQKEMVKTPNETPTAISPGEYFGFSDAVTEENWKQHVLTSHGANVLKALEDKIRDKRRNNEGRQQRWSRIISKSDLEVEKKRVMIHDDMTDFEFARRAVGRCPGCNKAADPSTCDFLGWDRMHNGIGYSKRNAFGMCEKCNNFKAGYLFSTYVAKAMQVSECTKSVPITELRQIAPPNEFELTNFESESFLNVAVTTIKRTENSFKNVGSYPTQIGSVDKAIAEAIVQRKEEVSKTAAVYPDPNGIVWNKGRYRSAWGTIEGTWSEDEDNVLLEVVANALNEERVSLNIQKDKTLNFDPDDIEVIRRDLALKGIWRMATSIESRLGGQVGNTIHTSVVLCSIESSDGDDVEDDGSSDERKPSAVTDGDDSSTASNSPTDLKVKFKKKPRYVAERTDQEYLLSVWSLSNPDPYHHTDALDQAKRRAASLGIAFTTGKSTFQNFRRTYMYRLYEAGKHTLYERLRNNASFARCIACQEIVHRALPKGQLPGETTQCSNCKTAGRYELLPRAPSADECPYLSFSSSSKANVNKRAKKHRETTNKQKKTKKKSSK